MAPVTTLSRFASAQTIIGDLPPSSSETGTIRCAPAPYTMRPAASEPVKVILAMSGCAVSAAPQEGPSPTTTFTTPSGRKRFRITAQARVAKGASSDALMTTVFPATSAGAIFSMVSTSGTFQGTMAPTTPSGSRVVVAKTDGSKGSVSPFNSEASPP